MPIWMAKICATAVNPFPVLGHHPAVAFLLSNNNNNSIIRGIVSVLRLPAEISGEAMSIVLLHPCSIPSTCSWDPLPYSPTIKITSLCIRSAFTAPPPPLILHLQSIAVNHSSNSHIRCSSLYSNSSRRWRPWEWRLPPWTPSTSRCLILSLIESSFRRHRHPWHPPALPVLCRLIQISPPLPPRLN